MSCFGSNPAIVCMMDPKRKNNNVSDSFPLQFPTAGWIHRDSLVSSWTLSDEVFSHIAVQFELTNT